MSIDKTISMCMLHPEGLLQYHAPTQAEHHETLKHQAAPKLDASKFKAIVSTYIANQYTVTKISMVAFSHGTVSFPSVLSFHRWQLAACSPAPAF